jgi:hypothetical protein
MIRRWCKEKVAPVCNFFFPLVRLHIIRRGWEEKVAHSAKKFFARIFCCASPTFLHLYTSSLINRQTFVAGGRKDRENQRLEKDPLAFLLLERRAHPTSSFF